MIAKAITPPVINICLCFIVICFNLFTYAIDSSIDSKVELCNISPFSQIHLENLCAYLHI